MIPAYTFRIVLNDNGIHLAFAGGNQTPLFEHFSAGAMLSIIFFDSLNLHRIIATLWWRGILLGPMTRTSVLAGAYRVGRPITDRSKLWTRRSAVLGSPR
jgi:hypothetical protein